MSAKAAADSKCYWGVFPRHRNSTPKHCIQRLTGKAAVELEAEPKLHCKLHVAPVLSIPMYISLMGTSSQKVSSPWQYFVLRIMSNEGFVGHLNATTPSA